MAETAIEWATHVWNPVTGCSRVSPGCAHCYALTYAARLKAMGQAKYQNDGGKASGPGFGVTIHESELAAPATWRAPRRVFVNSMSDLFHEEVPTLFIGRVLNAISAAPAHDFLVLTKRPQRMRDVMHAYYGALSSRVIFGLEEPPPTPLPNLWLGVSIENRRFVDRADMLRATPAAVRFISAEPLLGALTDAKCICCRLPVGHYDLCGGCANNWCDDCGVDEDTGLRPLGSVDPYDSWPSDRLSLHAIDWLIVGGESGPRARRVDPQWVRDLRDVARASGTDFFFKQWGGHTPKAGGRELDGRTWDEIPERAAVAA